MSSPAIEQAIMFGCAGEQLFGILHRPAAPSSTGVVVIVGGPQYRAGSHRQFVQLARRLAGNGYAVLRFDVTGMGDSSGAQRSFEQSTSDIGAAIDALREALPQVQRIVLYGLCDGASAALLYLHATGDARVCGICALNPWVRTPHSQARTQVKHYYTQRLRQRDFWVKLVRGGVGLKAIAGLAQGVRLATACGAVGAAGDTRPYTQRMAEAWRHFEGRVLLLLSGNDHTAKEFIELASIDPAWAGALRRPNVLRRDLADADHTLSDSRASRRAEDLMLAWLNEDGATGRQAGAPPVALGEYA